MIGPSKAYLHGSALSKEGHTHSGYALTDHSHSGYASSSHTHTPASIGAAASSHTHSNYMTSSQVNTAIANYTASAASLGNPKILYLAYNESYTLSASSYKTILLFIQQGGTATTSMVIPDVIHIFYKSSNTWYNSTGSTFTSQSVYTGDGYGLTLTVSGTSLILKNTSLSYEEKSYTILMLLG